MPHAPFDRVATADRLHSLAIHLLRAVRAGDDESGLTGPRLSALSVVVFAGPLSLTELADAEHVTTPTMTRLVHALEAAGVVRRETDSNDRRSIRLSATPKGRRILDAARRRRLAAMERLLGGVSDDDMAAIVRAVDVLSARLAAGA
ncbi:MAG TPA: MarR family transcriptional regulator [Gemmatimonadaceae bacterium]|nr:MarR family transcriptional regulator [Gemmatimonadaceae bacterium]